MDRDWKTQRSICIEVLHGRAEAAFEAYGVSVADQAIYRQMAAEAVAKVVARRSATKRYFKARIKNPIWVSTTLSSMVGAIAFAIAAMLTMTIDLSKTATFPILGGASAFSAIGVAAMGWGVSAWIAHRNNRSKYTLEVVASRFSQPAFTDALTSFNTMFLDRRIDMALITRLAASMDEHERKAVQGLRYLLNYFEFISVGVLEGELDERIVARTLRGNLVYIHDRGASYIAELQRRNPKTLEHFSRLRLHYREL